MNPKLTILFLTLITLVSCKKQEVRTEWYAAMSRPVLHPIEGPKVVYFYKGKIIGGTSTLTDIGNFGWGFPTGLQITGLTDIFPDSVAVNYGGLNKKLQMCTFNGGFKLPNEKIKKLFQNGYIYDGVKKNFDCITTGLAPGGNICVWVDHIEIARFKVKQVDTYYEKPVIIFEDSTEVINYLKFHPIDYTVWEKPDSRYAIDFGFCSEGSSVEFTALFFVSKEGIANDVLSNRIDFTKWEVPFGEQPDFQGRFYQQINEKSENNKSQLPVDVELQWQKSSNYFHTRIPMPKDFVDRFTKSYLNPISKKMSKYNRIVFGVEKDGEHCIVWLDGPGKQEKIMRFRGMPSLKDNKGKYLNIGSYATEVEYY